MGHFYRPTGKRVSTPIPGRFWTLDVLQISGKNLDGKATHLCSNPVYSYLAVSFENGKVELLWCDAETNELKVISKIVLCDEEISSVNFFSNGEQCVAASVPTGTFFCVHVSYAAGDSVESTTNVIFIATRSEFTSLCTTL